MIVREAQVQGRMLLAIDPKRLLLCAAYDGVDNKRGGSSVLEVSFVMFVVLIAAWIVAPERSTRPVESAN
jgi:hypothetical protein